MTQRNFLINTTTISTTASGTTIGSGNVSASGFVVARTLVRTAIGAGEFASGSQTWSLHYVVSAMTTPYNMRLKVQRRNSSGVMQAESGYTATRSATGTYDDNLTADLGIWAANDQLALVWEHERPSGTGNKNGTIDANGSSYIDAPTPPLDLPKTATDDVNNLVDAHTLGYGNLHADTINLADTAQVALGTLLAVSDNANTLADGAATVLGIWSFVNDSLQSFTDALAQLLTYQLALTDSEAASWADEHNLLLSQFLALTDSQTLSDAALLLLEQHESFTDSLTLSDALEQQIGVAQESADDLNFLADDLSLQLSHHLALSDGGSSFPTTGILDDFNRANEGPPPSSNWTTGLINSFGGFFLGHSVTSNQLSNDFEQVAQNYWNVEQFGPDCEAYITVTADTGIVTIILAARLVNLGRFTTDGYAVQVLPVGPGSVNRSYSILRADNGSTTPIAATSESGVGSIVGDKYGIQIIGDVIYLWGDTGSGWEVKLSVTDSTYSAAGFIGIVTEAGLTARWDDFGGGTVVAAGLSDALALTLGTGPVLTLGLSDALTTPTDSLALGHGLAHDDTLALSDTYEQQLAHLLSLADSATITDSESHQLEQRVTLADDLNLLTDSLALQLGYATSLADTLPALTDALALELAHRFSLSDSIDNLADTYAQVTITFLALSDPLTLTDSIQLDYGLALTEDINLFSDSIDTSAPQGPLRQVGVVDALDLSDSFVLQLDYLLEIADDAATLDDANALIEGMRAALSDSFALSDTLSVGLTQFLPLTDILLLTDAIQLRLSYESGLSDSIALTDAIALNLSLNLALSDNVSLLADSALESLGLTLIIADNAPTLTDAINLLSAWLLQFADTITLSDAIAKLSAVFLSVDDSLTLSDSVAVELRGPDLDEAVSDVLTLTDAISLTLGNELQLQVVISDAIALTDHYFDLRHPYTPSTKRHIVVPSRARTTTPTGRRGVIVPASERTTRVE